MTTTLAIDLVSQQVTGPYLGAIFLLAIPLAFGLLAALLSSSNEGKAFAGFLGGAGFATALRFFGRAVFTFAALLSMNIAVADPGDMGHFGSVLWQVIGGAVVLFCNLFRWGVRLVVLASTDSVLVGSFGLAFVVAAFVAPAMEADLALLVLLVVVTTAFVKVKRDELFAEESGLLFVGRW